MRKRKWRDTDFLYVSTRLRAASSSELTAEKLNRMLDAPTFAEAFSQVCDLYGADEEIRASGNYEALLDKALADAFALAVELIRGVIREKDGESAPEILLAPFRYVYDGQNLKALIKCEALERDARPLLTENGSIDVEDTLKAASEHEYGAYPAPLAAAAVEARTALAETGEPGQVDIILDRAIFAAMAAAAEESGLEYLKELVRVKTDSANIGIFLRCVRQQKSRAYFEKLYLTGGALDKDFFLSNYGETSEKLLAALAFTAYSELSACTDASEAARMCENLYAKQAYSAEKIAFGPELIVCFLVRKEYEVKNLRILLAGKSCGLSADRIKERLRGYDA